MWVSGSIRSLEVIVRSFFSLFLRFVVDVNFPRGDRLRCFCVDVK